MVHRETNVVDVDDLLLTMMLMLIDRYLLRVLVMNKERDWEEIDHWISSMLEQMEDRVDKPTMETSRVILDDDDFLYCVDRR